MQYNERDIEDPALISFVEKHKDIKSVLDVGACYSYATYANKLRALVKKYDGIDILPDQETEKILDKYIVDNVKNYNKKYDLVSCISTIEHAGISTYKTADHVKERRLIFKKLLDLSKKYVFLTFPYGKESFHENEFANITSKDLQVFTKMCSKVKTTFYFSEFPQGKIPFVEVEKEFANDVEYKRELGTRCVCIMEILK